MGYEKGGYRGDGGGTGPTGATGATGTTGTTGATGAQGTAGATGAQGTAGVTGAQGTAGATGAQGTAGATGAQGTAGATGAQGTAGATGAQGTAGATGAQGTAGATGAAGTAQGVQVEVSLAELNAGKTLVAGVEAQNIIVIDFNVVCDGSFGTLTSAELEDTSGTINVCSIAQAQMIDNAVLTKESTGVTLGVGVAEKLTTGESLVITHTGPDADTATKLTVSLTYVQS